MIFYFLMGHADVSTTMIYLHVMKRPGAGGPSPLDLPGIQKNLSLTNKPALIAAGQVLRDGLKTFS